MENKIKATKKDCYNEIVRLLEIMLFGKNDSQDEELLKKMLRNCLVGLGAIEHNAEIKKQEKQALKERKKLNLREQVNECIWVFRK